MDHAVAVRLIERGCYLDGMRQYLVQRQRSAVGGGQRRPMTDLQKQRVGGGGFRQVLGPALEGSRLRRQRDGSD